MHEKLASATFDRNGRGETLRIRPSWRPLKIRVYADDMRQNKMDTLIPVFRDECSRNRGNALQTKAQPIISVL
ncbi:MAG: hypothetical protein ACI4QT_06575, partial [Kiritimatiellia bacterium]